MRIKVDQIRHSGKVTCPADYQDACETLESTEAAPKSVSIVLGRWRASASDETAHPQPSVRRDCDELLHAGVIDRWAE